jgi:rhodanese-related sulfurtransferase
MGAKRTSTIGYERRNNQALHISDKNAFIASLTTDMPAAPDHFARCSAVNGAGPALVRTLPVPLPLPPAEFAGRAIRDAMVVLDVRPYDAFGAQHVPGAWNIDIRGNFSTFAGWTLPANKEILLVAEDEFTVETAAVALRRVGFDQVAGYLEGGMLGWNLAGMPTERIAQLSPQDFNHLYESKSGMILVDARSADEFKTVSIPGAINIPAPDIRRRYQELPQNKSIAIICGTGMRSSLAGSILQQKGFKDVFNIAGGMSGYFASGE